jgi:hypothetical protein
MGNTISTALTAGWEGGLSNVYGPLNLQPNAIVAGTNTFTLSTPFVWDGTSNLVIDICWANDPAGSCSSCSSTGTVIVPTTSTAFSSVHYATGFNNSFCGTGAAGTLTNARPNMILEGNYVALTAGSYNWQWNPGSINSNVANITATSSTTYTVTATDPATNCTSTASVYLDVTPSPLAPAGIPSAQCGSGVPQCSVVGSSGGIFHWFTVSTGGVAIANENGSQLLNYSIQQTTTFYVSENDGTCEGPRGMVVATVTQPDAISGSAPISVCTNSSLSLSSSKTTNTNGNIYTFSWSASPSAGSGISSSTPGQNIVVTPTAPGIYTYTVTGTDAQQGCATISTVVVNVSAPPVTPSALANPSTICVGNSSSLSANSYNYTSTSVTTLPLSNSNSVSGGAYWFNVDNTSPFPLTIHNFSVLTFTNSTLATVYYNAGPLTSCSVAPFIGNFTLIGSSPIVGLGSGTLTLIPLNLNITIPAGQTYSFAVEVNGILYSATAFTSTTCPIIANDANLAIHQGFGGTLSSPQVNRSPNIKIDYDIIVGSPSYTYSWSPGATLDNSYRSGFHLYFNRFCCSKYWWYNCHTNCIFKQ